jgi:capsular exopolysaccharide synthesis family protein
LAQEKEELNISALLQAQRELLLGPQQSPPPAPAALAEQPGEEDAFVNVRHYAFLIYGRKLWILLVTALVVGAAALYSYTRPRKFQATAEVVLSENFGGDSVLGRRRVYYDAEMLARMAELPEVDSLSLAAMKIEIEALLGGKVTLNSDERQALTDYQSTLASARGIKSGVAVDKYGVRLTATSEGSAPGRVLAMIAQAKAKACAQGLVGCFSRLAGGDREAERMDTLIRTNDDELAAVSARLAAAAKDVKLDLPTGVVGQLDRIQLKRRALVQAELERRELEQSIDELGKLVQGGVRTAAPETGARLLRLRTEHAQMRERYQEGHPKLKQAEAEIRAIEEFIRSGQDLNGEGGSRADGSSPLSAELVRLHRDARLAAARVEGLQKDIADAQQSLSADGGSPEVQNAISYQALIRQHRSLEEIGGELRRRHSEAVLAARAAKDKPGGDNPVRIRAVSEARLLGSSTGQNLGFAALLGLVMGVLLALLLEHLDDTVRSELTARRAANLPVIARLPRFESVDAKRYISPSSPRSDVAETFKFFHNHVRYAAHNAPERCLQITSPGPEEGKSYVAANLALSFASEGNRVCFVDADLRRSKTHERLEVLRPVGPVGRGLCGFLEGQLSYEDALVASEIENLHLILAGDRATNPPRLFRSDRMRELVERLQQEFDVVIIDAPPVLPVVDSAILSSLVRATLMVVRFGVTRQGDLAESAARLAHVNAPLVGVVINGVHGGAGGYYYYGRYRYRYGKGYGYGYGGYGNQ